MRLIANVLKISITIYVLKWSAFAKFISALMTHVQRLLGIVRHSSEYDRIKIDYANRVEG